MAIRYKSTFYISYLIATTVCLTLSIEGVSVSAVNRQSKQLLLGVVPNHSVYVNQPSASHFLPALTGRLPHSILDGSSNYFGIFPAFSGNQNCPPAPTCMTCPAAPPNKEDITTCGGASASPKGTIKIDGSSSVPAGSVCSYTLVTFKPFNKIIFQCDELSGGIVTLKALNNMNTAISYQGGTAIVDYCCVLVEINRKDTHSCSWSHA